jgi:Kdo2-lipid IVA lauroyltransferase/acyltransferase
MKKPIQSKIEYILFLGMYYSMKWMPLKTIKFLASQIMIFGGMVLGVRRDTADKNLRMVFPEMSRKDRNKIMKEMYRQMGKTAAETYFADFDKLYEDVELEGWENLEAAIAMNKGVILASCHTGNWELAGQFIHERHKLSVIYKKLRNRYLNTFTYAIRDDKGLVLIEVKKALRQILKLLKQKYIVTIMIDQNARKNGIITDFLGHPASTFVGTAKIAIKTKTPIVPAIALRLPNGKHKFIFEKPILPDEYKNTNEDIRTLSELASKQLEKYILKYPEQWFWVHRRWRGHKKARKN